jgi:hypothetical protein
MKCRWRMSEETKIDMQRVRDRANALSTKLFTFLSGEIRVGNEEDALVVLNAAINLMVVLENTLVKKENRKDFAEDTAKIMIENIVDVEAIAPSEPTV